MCIKFQASKLLVWWGAVDAILTRSNHKRSTFGEIRHRYDEGQTPEQAAGFILLARRQAVA